VTDVMGKAARRASALGRPVLWSLMLLALGLGGASLAGKPLPSGLLFASLLALLAVVATGVISQGSGVFARPIMAARTHRPELALTFDDGPDPANTLPILDVLEARGHRGTFFVTGDRAALHYEVLTEIARRGHGLANHSYRHAALTNLQSAGALASELETTSAIIARVTGSQPRWFRPPVGLLSPRVAEAALTAELELVAWTASARDGVSSRTAASALSRLLPHVQAGAILVLHDALQGGGVPVALAVLPRLLDRLEERGLRSVPLDQLFEASPSRIESPSAVTRRAS
jgi:peptidoglycan/xylan/chitin deacetylase (PgdA/CDA1 family)